MGIRNAEQISKVSGSAFNKLVTSYVLYQPRKGTLKGWPLRTKYGTKEQAVIHS